MASKTEQPLRALATLLVGLAIGLALNSILGPAVLGVIEYSIPAGGVIESQLIGLDVFTLAVVAPASIVLALLARQGHWMAPILALAPGLYAAYMFPQYILGPEHLDLPGNSAAFFPLQLGLFVLGGVVVAVAWSAIDLSRVPRPGRRERLVAGTLIPILAMLAFVRYVPWVIDVAGETPGSADYLEGPTFSWTIALLDLGIGLPAVLAAAIGVRLGLGWARKLALAVAGWLGLVGPAVGAMAITMFVNDVPDSSLGQALAMTVLGLLFAVLALALYGSLRAEGSPIPSERARGGDGACA